MAGPSNETKQTTTPSQKSDRDAATNQEFKGGARAENIIRQERVQHVKKGEELRTISTVRETSRARTTRLSNRRPAGQGSGLDEGRDPKTAGRNNQQQQKAQQQQREQRIEAVAFNYTNQERNRQQDVAAVQQGDPRIASETVMEGLTPGAGRDHEGREAFDAPNITGDRGADTEAAAQRFGTPAEAAGAAVMAINEEISAESRLGLGAQQQIVSLESLVGPEATLTFREKMHEVWGFLEQDSKAPLDVLAHAPLNVQGMNAMELLMVESPQGIHFVSFLRNGNDFEMLATFDRHALLPSNPSRQLVEAAIIAFQQINTIASDAANKLAEKLKELVEIEFETGGTKLGGVRAAAIRAKRVRENCKEADKRLLELLDQLEKAQKLEQAEQLEEGLNYKGLQELAEDKPVLENDELKRDKIKDEVPF